MVLEAVYEQDFFPCSYGFRPGRSAHQALRTICERAVGRACGGCSISTSRSISTRFRMTQLRAFLDRRVTDGVIRRMIDKWLKAGVVENGSCADATGLSPRRRGLALLSNIFLHHVLDEWFETEVRPRPEGATHPCPVCRRSRHGVRDHLDAKRVLSVLGQASWTVWAHAPSGQDTPHRLPLSPPGWPRHPATRDQLRLPRLDPCLGTVAQGKNMVLQVTAKGPFCPCAGCGDRLVPEKPALDDPHQHAHLSSMMRGHFAYYGVRGNGRRIAMVPHQVERIWQKWLSRRERQEFRWDRLREILSRHPLPPARIMRPIRRPERSSPLRNRMREICTSGSVRGGGGNVPTYSARRLLHLAAVVQAVEPA